MTRDGCITNVPGVQGGQPCVRGTRTPVSTIVILMYEAYAGNREEVQRALPHLTSAQVDAALDYYDAHREEIDSFIEENSRIYRHFVADSLRR